MSDKTNMPVSASNRIFPIVREENSKQLIRVDSSEGITVQGKPLRTANPRRGLPYHEMAKLFLADFPIGSQLLVSDFDDWAFKCDFLDRPGCDDKQSDSWKAHLQRRHELKKNILKASNHPRMMEDGFTPFTIEVYPGNPGFWEVQDAYTPIVDNRIEKSVGNLLARETRDLEYAVQSLEGRTIPETLQSKIWDVLESKDDFLSQVVLSEGIIRRKLTRINRELKALAAFYDAKALGE